MKILPIADAPGYFISDEGEVYSYFNQKGFRYWVIDMKTPPRRLKPSTDTSGYKQVTLSVNKHPKHYRIHQLVCTTFHGPRPLGFTTSHKDGNKLNNRADNLCWETLQDNVARRAIHGTNRIGFKNEKAKLTENQVRTIRILLKERNLTHKKIGELFGVDRPTITRISLGQRYKNQGIIQ